MRNLIRSAVLAAVLSTGLAGCATQMQQTGALIQTITTATVPEDAVITARVAFNSAQSLATSYLSLRRCNGSNGPICRNPALTNRIGSAVQAGRMARNRVTALMRANPGRGVPVADYNTMVQATNVIHDLTAAYSAARGR
jgi:hypothetical protein